VIWLADGVPSAVVEQLDEAWVCSFCGLDKTAAVAAIGFTPLAVTGTTAVAAGGTTGVGAAGDSEQLLFVLARKQSFCVDFQLKNKGVQL